MKVYKCVNDLQGGEWCVGTLAPIELWRQKAIWWVEDEGFTGYEEIVKEIENLPQDKVLDFIADFWQLEFDEGYEISCEFITYDSDIASFALINKNGTKIFLRRASHSDGYGQIGIFETESDLDKYLKENNLKLDSFDMRIEEGWKAMYSDCAKSYHDYGRQLHGDFIQIFRKGDDFFITLN